MARLLKLREHEIIADLDKLTYEQIAVKHNCCVKTVYNIKKRQDAQNILIGSNPSSSNNLNNPNTHNNINYNNTQNNSNFQNNSNYQNYQNDQKEYHINNNPKKLTKKEQQTNNYVDELLNKRNQQTSNKNTINQLNNIGQQKNISNKAKSKSEMRQKIDDLMKTINDN